MTRPEHKAPTGFIGNVKNRDEMDLGWQTPPELLSPVKTYFGGKIPFDVCTSEANPTDATEFWTPEDDALNCIWPESSYCNPPYGKAMQAWVEKAVEEAASGSEVLLLLSAARWEQGWWQTFISKVPYVCFIRGRVSFIRPSTGDRVSGNTYANMFAGLGIRRPVDWAEAFGRIGLCMKWKAVSDPPTRTAYQQWKGLSEPVGVRAVKIERRSPHA